MSFFPESCLRARLPLVGSRNVLGMLMETLGCSEQLDPFCGSLIIEHLLMARMFQQEGGLLVAVRLSPAVTTRVAASMHTCASRHTRVSVCMGMFVPLCYASVCEFV